MHAVRLHTTVRDAPPRGGAAMCETRDHVVVFGGADREQVSYQDAIAYKTTSSVASSSSVFALLDSTQGDVPMPRSGHAMVGYGKYAFLFGGIDFAEESVFNDLYLLDTDSWEWHYVGEAGEEVPARNSHSLAILSLDGCEQAVLVVYGGASPEHGALDDCYFAVLPAVHAIDPSSFHIHWQKLTQAGPGAREMHGSAALGAYLVVTGGRLESGELLSDTWVLELRGVSGDSAELVWESKAMLALPEGRCAHTAAWLSKGGATSQLCLYGGICPTGIAHEFFLLSQRALNTSAEERWAKGSVSNASVPVRFGHCMCDISAAALQSFASHSLYGSVMRREGIVAAQGSSAVLMFGGVNAEQDLGDLWVLTLA